MILQLLLKNGSDVPVPGRLLRNLKKKVENITID